MYAVIKTGGKQYKVTAGDVVKLEKLSAEEGKEVVFNEVLALDAPELTRNSLKLRHGHHAGHSFCPGTEAAGKIADIAYFNINLSKHNISPVPEYSAFPPGRP